MHFCSKATSKTLRRLGQLNQDLTENLIKARADLYANIERVRSSILTLSFEDFEALGTDKSILTHSRDVGVGTMCDAQVRGDYEQDAARLDSDLALEC